MNQPTNLSLLLLTHNDSQNIKENLKWLKRCPSISEIIAVDDKSTDDTANQLKKLVSKHLEVKIFPRQLNGDFASQRQFALSKTANDWIIWLDPDEKPNSQLISFLVDFRVGDYSAFYFYRQTQFLGSTLRFGETGNVKIVRLFDKNKGCFSGKVHESWQTTGSIADTPGVITHQSPTNLAQFLEKINFYSSIRANELYSQNKTTNLWQIIIYPKVKFIQNYFLRLGLLDGMPGLILALSMSLHSFLVRAKLWHLWHP